MRNIKQIDVKYFKAFSLIELVIVLGIIALLSIITIPSFQAGSQRRAFITTVDSFVEDIRSSRQKAISGVTLNSNSVEYWGIDLQVVGSRCTQYAVVAKEESVVSQTEIKPFSIDNAYIISPNCALSNGEILFTKLSGFLVGGGSTDIKIRDLNNKFEANISINQFGHISTQVIEL